MAPESVIISTPMEMLRLSDEAAGAPGKLPGEPWPLWDSTPCQPGIRESSYALSRLALGSIDVRKTTAKLESNSEVGRAHLLLIPQFAHELGVGVKVLVFCEVTCVTALRITVLSGTLRRSGKVWMLEVSPIGRRLDPVAKSHIEE